MNKKRLLLLGGSRYLLPVIETPHKLGAYVITCDYLPDNIAHKCSDEYRNIHIIDAGGYWCERAVHAGIGQPGMLKEIKNLFVEPRGIAKPFTGENISTGGMLLRLGFRKEFDDVMGKKREWFIIECKTGEDPLVTCASRYHSESRCTA